MSVSAGGASGHLGVCLLSMGSKGVSSVTKTCAPKFRQCQNARPKTRAVPFTNIVDRSDGSFNRIVKPSLPARPTPSAQPVQPKAQKQLELMCKADTSCKADTACKANDAPTCTTPNGNAYPGRQLVNLNGVAYVDRRPVAINGIPIKPGQFVPNLVCLWTSCLISVDTRDKLPSSAKTRSRESLAIVIATCYPSFVFVLHRFDITWRLRLDEL